MHAAMLALIGLAVSGDLSLPRDVVEIQTRSIAIPVYVEPTKQNDIDSLRLFVLCNPACSDLPRWESLSTTICFLPRGDRSILGLGYWSRYVVSMKGASVFQAYQAIESAGKTPSLTIQRGKESRTVTLVLANQRG